MLAASIFIPSIIVKAFWNEQKMCSFPLSSLSSASVPTSK